MSNAVPTTAVVATGKHTSEAITDQRLGAGLLSDPHTETANRVAADGVHLHDNDRTADQHLPPGDGVICWPDVWNAIAELPPSVVLCLELIAEEAPLEAIRRARDVVVRGMSLST